jgi:uncharacterized membrane protein
MVDVKANIVINRPTPVVASFAMDPDNAPRWYKNIKSVDWRTPKPLGAGSRIAFVARFLFKRLVYTYEVVDMVPDRWLRMKTKEGPFPMETSYEFEPIGAKKCRMHLRNRGTPRGFSSFITPALAYAMRAANRKDLARLKRLLERKSEATES